MSNKKHYYEYNKDANKLTDVTEEVIDEVVEDEVVEDESVEETVEETIVEEETLVGKVAGCKKLNIRKNPTKVSDPVHVALENDVLLIDTNYSTNEWYKVYTETGIEGYCMTQYVVVNQ